MAIEADIQQFIHNLEQGSIGKWLRLGLFAAIFASLGISWMTYRFNGFSTPEAMDQAQIGRQIANGQGFTTLYARPLNLNLLISRTGQVPTPLPELNQAPLGPIINSAALKLSGPQASMAESDSIYMPERIISAIGFMFFSGSLVILFLLGRQLFDPKVAIFGIGFIVVTDLLWQFSFSGLPQMAMLFFFSASLLLLVLALNRQDQGRSTHAVLLVLTASLLLGIMTLGHGIGLGIFGGFWIFTSLIVRPRRLVCLLTPLVYFIPLAPWALHNWHHLRNPFGASFYETYRGWETEPLALTANFEPLLRFRWADFLSNTAEQFTEMIGQLPRYFGGNFIALTFFLALIFYVYKRWQPSQVRWAIFLMWLGATLGMAIFGVGDSVSSNQLHIIFVPIMVFYGLGFLLDLWERLGIDNPMLRGFFLALLYLIIGMPLIVGLMTVPKRYNWPPYIPPLIQVFSTWIQPNEALAADIPWATAWYSERRSLLVPENIGQFELINSEQIIGAPLVALYLTPFSGNQPAYEASVNGRYRGWARFVAHEITPEELSEWVLKTGVELPLDGKSIMYADRPRWR